MAAVKRWTTKGWCPGALQPMESGDGLILRVRPRGAALSAADMRTIAAVSQTCGNGHIDLTRRANIQIRGVRVDALAQAQERLAAAALLDGSAGIEALRNILLSPLAGDDETALADGTTIAAAIEHGLHTRDALLSLPPMFSFLVDEGGRLPLADVSADIRLRAGRAGILVSAGGDEAEAVPLLIVAPATAAATALSLAEGFRRLNEAGTYRKMKDALRDRGAAALLAAACLRADTAPSAQAGRGTRAADLYGRHDTYRGVGAPFGSLTAETLARLAALSPAGIRLTPWRAMLLPDFPAEREPALAALDLVHDAVDPRLRVAACPGAPACSSGEAPARAIAGTLAGLLNDAFGGNGIALHVSGCAKGCAHGKPAAMTLVGNRGGYDLVLAGRAADRPVRTRLGLAELPAALRASPVCPKALAS